MTAQTFGIILGVLGFFISIYNLFSAIRRSTVVPQAELLAELRGYLDLTVRQCQTVRPRLDFDRYLLHTGHRPEIPGRPGEFDTALRRLPELGGTLSSIGQDQIEIFQYLIRDITYFWDILKQCTDSDPVNVNALENARRLKRLCFMVDQFLPEYVSAITSINKGNLWKRFRYRDHRPIVYKLFRWTPLRQAVNDYERILMAREQE
jgi:hypothetical protein